MKQAEVILAVANLGTATASEVATAVTGDDDAPAEIATSAIGKCYEYGYLVRRKRDVDNGRRNPFEYAVASIETARRDDGDAGADG